MRIWSTGSAAACLICAAGAHAEIPLPERGWVVHVSEAQCTVARAVFEPFRATLVVRAYPSLAEYELMLIPKDPPKDTRSERMSVDISFEPSGAVHRTMAKVNSPARSGARGLGAYTLPVSFYRDFAASEGITIAAGETPIGTFRYQGAEKVTRVLEECSKVKLTEWGADPAALEADATYARPIGDTKKWVTPDDFRVLGRLARATAISRLSIAADGTVDGCHVLEANHESVGKDACNALLNTARFEPARGKDGKGLRAVALHKIDHALPMEVRKGTKLPTE